MNTVYLKYIPHGINKDVFYPITDENEKDKLRVEEIKKNIFGDDVPEFIMFYNNRNIRRKQTSNTILAFKEFTKLLPEEKRSKCAYILHTQPIDENGTNLQEVVTKLAPECRILFSAGKVDSKDLNCLYNICDITINIANAEGFGLGTAESLMAGTPIVATVTGGLQDQMRFLDENNNPIQFTKEWGSNSDGLYKDTHAEWAFPVFPATRTLVGSVPTPYIFDDNGDWIESSKQIKKAYDLGRDELKRRGKMAREWMLTKESGMEAVEMCGRFIEGIDTVFEKWIPKKRFVVKKV